MRRPRPKKGRPEHFVRGRVQNGRRRLLRASAPRQCVTRPRPCMTRPRPCMTRPRQCWQSPVICWQATPAFHNTTVASHDATAASHDATAASYDTTVTSHDTNVASPNTTAICAGAQDAFRGPTTSTLAKSPNVLGSTLASTSNSPVQRTRFDTVLPRLPQQLTRRVADCAKIELVSTHFKPGRPECSLTKLECSLTNRRTSGRRGNPGG